MKKKKQFLSYTKIVSTLLWLGLVIIGGIKMITVDFFEGFVMVALSLIIFKLQLMDLEEEVI